MVAISVIMRQFKVLPANRDELLEVEPKSGIVTAPDQDAWFILERQ